MEEWRKATIFSLVEAASAAVARARFVFLVSNIACLLILMGMFNAYMPWIRNTILRAGIDPDLKAILQNDIYRDLQVLQLPVLGVRVSVFDLPLLGACALLVIAVWYLFSVRRENHVLNAVANEMRNCIAEGNRPAVKYLYAAIAHKFVFVTSTTDDTPGDKSSDVSKFARAVVDGLVSLMWLLPIGLVGVELLTTAMPMSVRVVRIGAGDGGSLWGDLHENERVELVVRLMVVLGLGWAIWRFVRLSRGFTRETQHVLSSMMTQSDQDLKGEQVRRAERANVK